MNDATGHYNAFMSQAVMEEWIFDSADVNNWSLINGGMEMMTSGMLKLIRHKPVVRNRVTDILKNPDGSIKVAASTTTAGRLCPRHLHRAPRRPSDHQHDRSSTSTTTRTRPSARLRTRAPPNRHTCRRDPSLHLPYIDTWY